MFAPLYFCKTKAECVNRIISMKWPSHSCHLIVRLKVSQPNPEVVRVPVALQLDYQAVNQVPQGNGHVTVRMAPS